jgi:hypothetical protein
LVHGSQVQA